MTELKAKFQLGEIVVDSISNFHGTITGIAFYLNSLILYLVTSFSKDGKELNENWIDENRLKSIIK